MSSSAPNRLRLRIESLRLRLEDCLLARVADRVDWSYGRQVECVSVSVLGASGSLAVLARDFVPCSTGASGPAWRSDPALERLIAAWELPGARVPCAG